MSDGNSGSVSFCFHTIIYAFIMYTKSISFIIITTAMILASCGAAGNPSSYNAIAFPGAEGAGKYTTGGRGGFIYKVTNLDDAGPGSLRYGVQMRGARTIVFDVAGNIQLDSMLYIDHGDLTIAGQSAPGSGICLTGHGVRIRANNVIMRFIRIRPGDVFPLEQDALTGINHRDIIIDHCSMSWGNDEVLSLYNIENLTVQWCIVSEALNDSHHHKGEHGYGGIWGGNKATFHHNLVAHNNSRNPRFQGGRRLRDGQQELVEMVNNVVYNWQSKAAYGGEEGFYNMIGNYFKPGPATNSSERELFLEPYAPLGKYYLYGNVMYGSEKVTENNLLGVNTRRGELDDMVVFEPYAVSDLVPVSAHEAFDAVLNYAGASHLRDALDTRIIEEVRNGTYTFGDNGIINGQDEVGGWPYLEPGTPMIDTDGDGMPDEWEIANGLDPNNPNDYAEYSLSNQFTNIEVYLNNLVIR